MFQNMEFMKSVENKWKVYIVYRKNDENCGSLALKLIPEFFAKLLVLILFLC